MGQPQNFQKTEINNEMPILDEEILANKVLNERNYKNYKYDVYKKLGTKN